MELLLTLSLTNTIFFEGNSEVYYAILLVSKPAHIKNHAREHGMSAQTCTVSIVLTSYLPGSESLVSTFSDRQHSCYIIHFKQVSQGNEILLIGNVSLETNS